MTNFINTLNYGNCDISQWEGSGFNKNSLIDGFWLESSLLISPREQEGWFVGFFESNRETTYFTVYLSEKQGAYGPKAQEITCNIVQGYF